MSSEIGPSRGGWRGRIWVSSTGWARRLTGPHASVIMARRLPGSIWRARLDSRAREVGSRVGDGIRLGWATKKFPSHRAFCAAAPLTSPSITHPRKGVRSERFIREPPRGFEPHSHHPAGGRQKGGSRERLPHCTECGSRSHKRACRSGVGVETKGWTRFRAPTRSRGAGRGSEPRRGQEGLDVVPAV